MSVLIKLCRAVKFYLYDLPFTVHLLWISSPFIRGRGVKRQLYIKYTLPGSKSVVNQKHNGKYRVLMRTKRVRTPSNAFGDKLPSLNLNPNYSSQTLQTRLFVLPLHTTWGQHSLITPAFTLKYTYSKWLFFYIYIFTWHNKNVAQNIWNNI